MSETEANANNSAAFGKESDVLNEMENQKFDAAVVDMQNQIQQDIANKSSLLGDHQSLAELSQEYAPDDASYQDKIKKLGETYTSIRRTRGDGNCFFRSFGFGYLEYLAKNKGDFEKFQEKASKTFQKLMDLNYPSFTVEDFFENFMSSVKSVTETDYKVDDLVEKFRDDAISNYFIVYLRLITSCQMQTEAHFYQDFVDSGKTVTEFCKTEVEPMYKESDHMHIIALTAALDAKIRVVYMDHSNATLLLHDFPEGCKPAIHLLYRPGHYDILYPK